MILGKVTNPVRYIGGVTTTRVPLPAPVHPMCARMAGFAMPFDIDLAIESAEQKLEADIEDLRLWLRGPGREVWGRCRSCENDFHLHWWTPEEAVIEAGHYYYYYYYYCGGGDRCIP